MKRIILHLTFAIGIVLMVFTYACTDRPHTPQLIEAENLMEERPDSAYAILNKIENTNLLSEKDHAIYCLLLTQAQDLNYITHTSDSLIKIAANYFEKHDDKPRTTLANYYLGRVNSDLHDALQAQEYYLKALEMGESSKDYTLLIKIYNNLGTLYAYQDLNDMALPMYKKVLSYLELEPDSVKMGFALRNVARIFASTQQIDSALYYYQQAICYVTPTNRSSIYLSLGNLYYDKGEYQKADEYIGKALSYATNRSTLGPVYLSKGKLLATIGEYDSAKHYLRKGLESSYIYTKAGSYQRLAQIALKEEKLHDYVKYVKEYEELRDSITKHSHFENIRIVQSMFNYQQIAKEKSKFEKEATLRMIFIYQIIIIFTTIFISSFVIVKKEQNKKKRSAELKEEQYKRSQQYIKDNEKQILQLTTKLQSKQEEISEAERKLYNARKLALEMENRQINISHGTIRLLEKDFHSSSIYIRIHREERISLSSSEWEELHLLLDATYPNFTNRLIKIYPQITNEEIHICYLVKMRLPIGKIAIIMNITSSGVSHCRKRLYHKFTGESPNIEKFDKFIIDL